MPLFEVETDSHIIITWASDSDEASGVVSEAYPHDTVLRLTKRPRDTWVISKSALGINGKLDPCNTARDWDSRFPAASAPVRVTRRLQSARYARRLPPTRRISPFVAARVARIRSRWQTHRACHCRE